MTKSLAWIFFSASTFIIPSSFALPYPIKADVLNCRAEPNTSSATQKQYTSGADIQISCQTTGTDVEGTTVWDKTQDGCYVSDFYVQTGHRAFIPGVPRCGGESNDPNPPSGPKPPASGGPCPTINDATVSLIKEFEGFVRSPSPDPIGLPTVGYGHLCQTKSCSEAGDFPLSEADAAALLKKDAARFTACLNDYINDSVKLNDNQMGALTSWAFNMGCGAVKTSTLIQRLNKGEAPNTVVAEELPRWNKAGGNVMSGLVRRRKAEVALFQKASDKEAHPSCAA